MEYSLEDSCATMDATSLSASSNHFQAGEGAKVSGCDIDAARASATVAAAQMAGLAIESTHPIDLTQPADVQRCVDQVIKRRGRIDVLVNAGAINPQFAPVSEMSYERLWVPDMTTIP